MKGTLVTKVYQVVVYHNVTNPEKLAAYAELAGPAMKSAGATFLARGIPYLVREEGVATRTVLIEWPSREAADAGYNSPCLLYTSPSPRDRVLSRMPSSA